MKRPGLWQLKKKILKFFFFTAIILTSSVRIIIGQAIVVEAEDGDLQGSNTRVESSADGFSGTGYVTGFETDGDAVVVTVDIPESGDYTLSVGFSAPYGEKDNYISINGTIVDTVHFPEISGFSEVVAGDFQLEEGQNTIGFHHFWGWCFLDYFKVTDIAPRGDFTYDPEAIATGDTISFDASGTYDPNGEIVSYEWDFGDGNSGSGMIVKHVYAREGLKTIKLSLTDNDDNTSQIVKQIEVSRAEPFAVFQISEKYPQPSSSIDFDGSLSYDQTGTVISWEWYFGDGNSGTGEIVSHNYTTAGNYEVALTVTNTKGKSNTHKRTLFVYGPEIIIRGPQLLTAEPETNKKIELDFQVKADYDNPYNPEEVRVDAVINYPGGQDSLIVPCFYYREVFFRGGNWETDSTIQAWRLRFSVNDTGEYAVKLKYTGDSIVYGTDYNVHVDTGNTKGIIRNDSINKQYYRHATGEPFFPLGINIGWNNIGSYASILNNIAAYNANFFRYWHTPFANQALEWTEDNFYDGLGIYSQKAARMTDSLLTLGNELGIYMQLVIFQHGPFSENVNPIWNENPYNSANGGFVNDAEAFFYNNDCKRYTKKLLRYIVARWGYSPNIFAWEFFNEVQFTGNHPNQSAQWYDAIQVWHSEMSQYVESIDPFDHIMTTSAEHDQLYDFDSISAIDVLQYHLYNANLLEVQKKNDYEFLDNLNTPVINGEYGENVNTADVPIKKQQTSLWNGIFTQVPHIMWLWDNYHKDEWGALFRYPSLYFQDEDMAKHETLTGNNFSARMEDIDLGTTGLADDSVFYGVVYHPDGDLIQNASIEDLQLPFANYNITFYLSSENAVTERENVPLIRAYNTIYLPRAVNDIAFKIKYNSEYTLPIALAGPDQFIPLGNSIILDGSASLDPNELPLNYSWELVEKPVSSTLEINDATTPVIEVEPDISGYYYFKLTVDNGTDFSVPDTVIVVSSTMPVADAGPDMSASPRQSVLLDGSNSYDPDGEPIVFLWEIVEQPDDSDPSLFNYTDTVAIFRSITTGEYLITLVVNDGIQPSDPDTVKVTVEDPGSITDFINDQVKIYPNPAHNKLFIEAGTTGKQTMKVDIVNISGRLMISKQLSTENSANGSLMTMDLSKISGKKGLYLIKLMTTDQKQVTKYLLIE